MKFLNFLRWWWKNLNDAYKPIIIVIGSLVTLFGGGLLFGIKFFFYSILTIILILVAFLLYALCKAMYHQWGKYNDHLERERTQIVNRLRGQ